MIRFTIWLFIFFSISLSFATAQDIVSPLRSAPAKVEPGSILEVLIRLRLPLTPPPGVQQSSARLGWEARLSRQDVIAKEGVSSLVEYPLRLIRIRPGGDGLYRISAELMPWMPEGLYTLEIRGPGIQSTEQKAVLVGTTASAGSANAVTVKQVNPNEIEVENHERKDVSWLFNIIVPADFPGLNVELEGHPIRPRSVAWAEPPITDRPLRRILVFVIPVPGATPHGPGKKTIKWSKANRKSLSARILWAGTQKAVDPMAWTDLELQARSFDPISVIWDFGDGQWGKGRHIRHRFLLSDKATVNAAAFDPLGRVARTRASAPLRLPLDHSNCTCSETLGVSRVIRSNWLEIVLAR